MACFTAPLAEAIVVTVAKKIVEKKEASVNLSETVSGEKLPFSKKLGWLSNMLWGGSALLAFEHVWHGEVVPYFPFLTAALNPADLVQMLREIATTGVCMALLVTAVWGVLVAVSARFEKKQKKTNLNPAL